MSGTNDTNEMFSSLDLSAMIEKLKEHPEIVSGVASTLGLGTPQQQSEDGEADTSGKSPDMLSFLAPIVSAKGGSSKSEDQRTALLIALKPYLSAERREIVDYIIKFSKMGDMIKKIK